MLKLGTRKSALAWAQSGQVARAVGPDVALTGVTTEGDRLVDVPLRGPLAKGFFTEALESGLREGAFDLAVHSLKDLPVDGPADLVLGAIPVRAPAADLLLVREDAWADDETHPLPLHPGARVGASSPRRQALLATLAPGVVPTFLRGNVTTRLERLARGDFEAIILAEAGVSRLGMALPAGIRVVRLKVEAWPPAPGQGALAIQCRVSDADVRSRLAALHDPRTAAAVTLERALLARLGGGCSLPFGAWSGGEDWVVGLALPGGPFRILRGTGPGAEAAVDALQAGQGGEAVTGRAWEPAFLSSILELPAVPAQPDPAEVSP